jgi:cytochrome c-type biogenesis protein
VLDGLTLAYAFGAGAASFFSPCSAGLLPAYVGYFLTTGDATEPARPARRVGKGILLGLGASAGFFALLVATAGLIALVPLRSFVAALPYVSIVIGALIVALGALYAIGRGPTMPLPRALVARSPRSVFFFGVAYALASLGCTFPVFLSVVLAGVSTGSTVTSVVSLMVFAGGMSLVMIAITLGLALSESAARRLLRAALAHVPRAAAIVMIVAGLYVIYYWTSTLGWIPKVIE